MIISIAQVQKGLTMSGKDVRLTRPVARFDIPVDKSTTIYIDNEPALVIEP